MMLGYKRSKYCANYFLQVIRVIKKGFCIRRLGRRKHYVIYRENNV